LQCTNQYKNVDCLLIWSSFSSSEKIKDESLRVSVLKAVEEIMYSTNLIQRDVAVLRAKQKIVGLRQRFPGAGGFISYFEETCSEKTAMWVTANRNFPRLRP
jgi:hypothetical protein